MTEAKLGEKEKFINIGIGGWLGRFHRSAVK